jgi:flagellin
MQVQALSRYDGPAFQSIVGRIGVNRKNMLSSLDKLSSGMKINSAGDSPSGLAMSERLRSLIGRYDAAVTNADNAVSYLQTSDSFMQSMQNTVGRMQELAIAANDGTKSDTDRKLLAEEFEQLKTGLTDVTDGASPLGSFNGKALFQGNSMEVAIGPESGETMSFAELDLTSSSSASIGKDHNGQDVAWSSVVTAENGGGISIATQAGASDSIEALSMANDYLSSARAVGGAEQERVSQTIQGLRQAQVNSVSAESGIRDTDIAAEMINFSKYQAMTLLGNKMLAGQISSRFLTQA